MDARAAGQLWGGTSLSVRLREVVGGVQCRPWEPSRHHHICPPQGILFRDTSCMQSEAGTLQLEPRVLPYLLHELIPMLSVGA